MQAESVVASPCKYLAVVVGTGITLETWTSVVGSGSGSGTAVVVVVAGSVVVVINSVVVGAVVVLPPSPGIDFGLPQATPRTRTATAAHLPTERVQAGANLVQARDNLDTSRVSRFIA